jgi:SSS family solute:Na+ symporter
MCRVWREQGVAFWGLFDRFATAPGHRQLLQQAALAVDVYLPNGQEFWALGMATAGCLYVLVSLLYRPRVFDLDRLLHRGRYRVPEESTVREAAPARGWRVLGMGREFGRRDRALYILTYVWTAGWTLVFIVGTITMLNRGDLQGNRAVNDEGWCRYWHLYLWIHLGVSAVVVVWFTVGGWRDVRAMLRRLAVMERDDTDDGMVRPEETTG